MSKFKYAAGLWAIGGTADRFLTSGYVENPPGLIELTKKAATVTDLKGIEVINTQLDGVDVGEYKKLLDDLGLTAISVLANTFGLRKYKLGALTHTDPKIRQEAIDQGKKSLDLAKELGADNINLWLGTDGYDYSFQINYEKHLDMLLEAIREIAEYAKKMDLKVALEYKLREPRNFMTIGAVGKALYMSMQAGDNVGIILDFGHSLMARENPAESVFWLAREKRLFGVHVNDAYGDWDDDLNTGVVHFHQTLEFLYALDVTNYSGWVSLDIFPYRLDGLKAASLCIEYMKEMEEILERLDYEELKKAQLTLDAGNTQPIIKRAIFGK